MKKTAWIYLLIGIGILAFTFVATGVGVQFYIDIPTFIIVPVLGFVIGCISHGFNGIIYAYKNALGDKNQVSRSEAGKSIAVFDSIIAGTWYAGGFGALAGLIAMLGNLEDSAGISKGLAVLLLSLLYAIFVIMFFILPFKSHLEAVAAEKE